MKDQQQRPFTELALGIRHGVDLRVDPARAANMFLLLPLALNQTEAAGNGLSELLLL